jgi:stage V sporulation protein D (sporulation-specific penicillin-binding protein)
LLLKLSTITVQNGDEYKKIVLSQKSYSSETIPYERGEILDRNGTKLATNQKVYNLILDPKLLLENEKSIEPTLEALSVCYGYDKEELEEKIRNRPNSSYYCYKKELSQDEMDKFLDYQDAYNNNKTSDETETSETGTSEETTQQATEDSTEESTESTTKAKIQGVWFESEYKRVYPYDSLACDTIGFSSSSSGVSGLEAYYNDVLSGTNGRQYGYLADESSVEKVTVSAINGQTLVTSLDTYIQQVCEKIVQDYDDSVGCLNASLLVMNPKTSEIYAMASTDAFDLNNPYDLSGYYTDEEISKMSSKEKSKALLELWQNYCTTTPFEPGSTAKAFTISAAIEEDVLQGTESYTCDGVGVYGGSKIHCYQRSGHGKLTVTEALMYSCNDVLMQIAMKEGNEIFCKYQDLFGIGKLTGIDLPDENSCESLKYTLENMGIVDLATNSFGQNYYTTMIQVAAAYASIWNGGNYYTPHLVKQILDTDGNVVENVDPVLVRKTISSSTSEYMKEALFQVCEEGSGKKAAIEGYEMGGKTATAEKMNQGAADSEEDETYVVSFIAAVPAHDPEVLVYALVDEPNIAKQSDSSQATELCKKAMKKILPYLNIYPSKDDETDTETSSDNQDANASDTNTQDTDNQTDEEEVKNVDLENIEVFDGPMVEDADENDNQADDDDNANEADDDNEADNGADSGN